MRCTAALATLILATIWSTDAPASSLRVIPTTIDRTAPAATASLTLSNHGQRPLNVQVRVFRWIQTDGKDLLQATRDVVISPPMTSLEPGIDHTVRVVRISKQPVSGEESYRVIVDELPKPNGAGKGINIAFLLRYSIPVFFAAESAVAADVAWQVRRDGRRLIVSAANSGGVRAKVADLEIHDASGRSQTIARGLGGYVLAGATKTWSVSQGNLRLGAGGTIHYRTDSGLVDVPVTVRGDR